MGRPQSISDAQILQAAYSCFVEHGPGVATEVIASRLNVTAQALLKRFGSKNALMIAALKPPAIAPWIPLVESGPDERPLRQQLTEILLEVASFFLEIAERITVLRWSGIDPKALLAEYQEPPPLLDIRTLAAWFQRAADRGMLRSADFPAVAMMLLTSLHGPTMLTELIGAHPTGHSTKEYVDQLVDVMLNGLSVDRSPVTWNQVCSNEL